MQPTDDNPDRAALRALEIAMREVLEGMEDFSLQVAFLHADFPVPIVDADGAEDRRIRPADPMKSHEHRSCPSRVQRRTADLRPVGAYAA